MSRETYETYSAEPEKIDLIAFLAEYFQAFRKFFLGVLILVILMGGGSFLTAKLRYQPMYEAYTSFVVGSNRAVGYSYYDNVTAQQLGKTFPYIVTSGVLKDVVARDLQVGAVTSQIEASVMENTNLFTIRVKDSSPDTAYRVLQSVITNYPEVAEYIIGATTLTVVDDSGVPVSPINSQDAVHAGMIGAAAGLAVALLLVFTLPIWKKVHPHQDLCRE
jgi:succinoglycan biosynthesis transport protein ExoP